MHAFGSRDARVPRVAVRSKPRSLRPRASLWALVPLLAVTGAAVLAASAATPVAGQPIETDDIAVVVPPDTETDDVAVVVSPVTETDVGELTDSARSYIVVLDEPPVAQYQGGTLGYQPTAQQTNRKEGAPQSAPRGPHLDVNSDASLVYAQYLTRRQDSVIGQIAAIAPETEVGWRYQIVLNGFAAEMEPRHAVEAARLPGVRVVYPSQEIFFEMDSTIGHIGADQAWETMSGHEQAGLGTRIAILDSGSDASHPFMHDEGMPPAPEGFPTVTLHGRDGTVLEYIPERIMEWTNNKVIGARMFDTVADQDAMNRRSPSALSGGSHGMHTSGTAAGRHGIYTVPLFGLGAAGVREIDLELSGIAPMAQVLVYKVWDETPGMVAAFEQMVRDEIDAVNLSLGTASWLLDTPETHPIAMAAGAAADAGVVVVASSGNAGANGRASLSGAWKYSERVLAVGNTTSTGSFDQPLTLEGEMVPEELKTLISASRGSIMITESIKAPLFLADNGGCDESPLARGKIAIAERFDETGAAIGPCGYSTRSLRMANSGAVAIVYVYYNRWLGGGSTAALQLPGAALGLNGGPELVEWLQAGGVATGTLSADIVRSYVNERPDVLSSSSSIGPGLNWEIKPDITAPGSNILSSVWGRDSDSNPVGYFSTMSGTSMSAPHVTGSAALIRSMHPNWTADQVRSTLINTSVPQVKIGGTTDSRPALFTESGPGRVDLTKVHDPGAILSPPKLNFGHVDHGLPKQVPVMLESVAEEATLWRVEAEAIGGDGEVTIEPDQLLVAPGDTARFTVTLLTGDLTDTEQWGNVYLTAATMKQVYLPSLLNGASFGEVEPGETPEPPLDPTPEGNRSLLQDPPIAPGPEAPDFALRMAYHAYVDIPANRDNVLIVDWTYGDTEDYTSYYTSTLEALGLTYNIWAMGESSDGHEDRKTQHPSFDEMFRHDLVILNANMSPVSLQEQLRGQFQYQNLGMRGGSLLVAGQGTQDWWRYLGGSPLADTEENRAALPDTWPYRWYGPSQNYGCEMCIVRYFGGFTPEYTSTLSGRLLLPYPTAPDTPEMEVVLEPHADAEGIFDYPLDISTGELAPDGAAGNQYSFASGEVVREYVPTSSVTLTSGLGDIGDAEVVMDRAIPFARPLWTYPVSDTQKVVGTYIAGRVDHGTEVPWNVMFWGFGLEGVGEGAAGTVSRERLLGDTFNFLARSLYIALEPDLGEARAVEIAVTVPTGTGVRIPMIGGAEVDWGDGSDIEVIDIDPLVPADQVTFAHEYADAGTYAVSVTITADDEAEFAPLHGSVEIEVE